MFASYFPLWPDWCDHVARPPSNEIAATKSKPIDVPFALEVFRIRCLERIVCSSTRPARSARDRVYNSMQPIPSSMWSPNRANGWYDDQRMPADLPEIEKEKSKSWKSKHISKRNSPVHDGDAVKANEAHNGNENAVTDANDAVNDAPASNFDAFLPENSNCLARWRTMFRRLRTWFDSNRPVSRLPRYWTQRCQHTTSRRIPIAIISLVVSYTKTVSYSGSLFKATHNFYSLAEILKIDLCKCFSIPCAHNSCLW